MPVPRRRVVDFVGGDHLDRTIARGIDQRLDDEVGQEGLNGWVYQSTDCYASGDGGNGAGASVAGNAAAGGEAGEEEGLG